VWYRIGASLLLGGAPSHCLSKHSGENRPAGTQNGGKCFGGSKKFVEWFTTP